MKIPCSLTVILLFPLLVNAYSWKFTSLPRQCQNVSLFIQGSGGQPPYSFLIIPFGASPFPNSTEVRSVQRIPFSGTNTTLSFKLNYPANSSFVAVVSDKNGFGSGGTSTPVTVLQSSDSSCYDPSKSVPNVWYYNFGPTGGPTQCEPLWLWWESAEVNGTVSFYGTIPGGTSFVIPQGPLSTDDITGTGFNWTVDIAAGLHILIIGNDDRGIGTGGHTENPVVYAANNSCLNNNSPSSTLGNPAGGSYPTSTNEPSSGSHSNTGAIIGGVVGAVILLVSTGLAAFWFARRRSYSALSQRRPVNVLEDDEDENEEGHDFPQHYVLEPYLVPDPTIRGTSEASSTHDLPLSMSTFTADVQRLQAPMTPSMTTNKSAAPPQLRPVNIIQHEDAGHSEGLLDQAKPETIELPPAYPNIPQRQWSPFTSSTATTAEDES